jgi:serine/threonine protein kinase
MGRSALVGSGQFTEQLVCRQRKLWRWWVRHQFVLELVGAHITEPYRIITRFCQGKSLFDHLHRSNKAVYSLSPTRLTIIAYEVAVGIEYLPSLGIVHRDLETLNILLDEEDDGCVADFGFSGMMKDIQELAGGVGTPHYTAPEVLSHTRYVPKVDAF